MLSLALLACTPPVEPPSAPPAACGGAREAAARAAGLLAEGRLDRAERVASRVSASGAGCPEARLDAARTALAALSALGRVEEARELARALSREALSPDDRRAAETALAASRPEPVQHAPLAEAFALEAKDPVRALAIYDEALARDPNDVVALAAAGTLRLRRGENADGRRQLDRAQAELRRRTGEPGHPVLVRPRGAGDRRTYHAFLFPEGARGDALVRARGDGWTAVRWISGDSAMTDARPALRYRTNAEGDLYRVEEREVEDVKLGHFERVAPRSDGERIFACNAEASVILDAEGRELGRRPRGCATQRVHFWNEGALLLLEEVGDGCVVSTLPALEPVVDAPQAERCEPAPDGRHVLVERRSGVDFYAVAERRVVASLSTTGESAAHFSPDGTRASVTDTAYRVVDLASGAVSRLGDAERRGSLYSPLGRDGLFFGADGLLCAAERYGNRIVASPTQGLAPDSMCFPVGRGGAVALQVPVTPGFEIVRDSFRVDTEPMATALPASASADGRYVALMERMPLGRGDSRAEWGQQRLVPHALLVLATSPLRLVRRIPLRDARYAESIGWSVRFEPDGSAVTWQDMTNGGDDTMRCYTVPDGERCDDAPLDPMGDDPVHGRVLATDALRVLVADAYAVWANEGDGWLRLQDLAGGGGRTLEAPFCGAAVGAGAFALWDCGHRTMTHVRLDVDSESELSLSRASTAAAGMGRHARVAPLGDQLLVSDVESVKLFDHVGDALTLRGKFIQKPSVSALALAPGGRTFALRDGSGSYLVDVATGHRTPVAPCTSPRFLDAATLACGDELVAVPGEEPPPDTVAVLGLEAGGRVRLRRAGEGQAETRTFGLRPGWPTPVDFAQDAAGGLLFTVGPEKSVAVYDLPTGEERAVLVPTATGVVTFLPGDAVEIWGEPPDELACRFGDVLAPFDVCAERHVVRHAYAAALQGDASYLDP